MKKLIFSALAILALASCNNEETIGISSDAAITFNNVFVNNATRANDLTKDNIQNFGVYGSVEANGSKGLIFNNTQVSKAADGKFTYSPVQYWIANAQYYFAAIAPYANAAWSYALTTATDAQTGTITFNNETAAANQDLLFAFNKPNQTPEAITAAPAAVAFDFNHMLSRVMFTFNNKFDEGSNMSFQVTDVNVTNAGKVGTLAITDGVVANDWTVADDNNNLNVDFSNATTTAADDQDIVAIGGSAATTHYYFIPAERTYNVTFNITLYQAGVKVAEYARTASFDFDLAIGNSYNIVANLTYKNVSEDDELYPIEFTVNSVDEWDNYNDVTANVAQTVYTADELLAAVAAGTDVVLNTDIDLGKKTVLVNGDKTVSIDLNGCDITATTDGFEVADNATLNIYANKGGKVAAASNNEEPYCAVWAHGNGVVNIYGGEFSIGYPANDYNDLIYAKENASISIYGGKFYNSGKENSFVLNIKDNNPASIVVYGGEFEKFDPANNLSEGPGTNFVAPGYKSVADGDWYKVIAE